MALAGAAMITNKAMAAKSALSRFMIQEPLFSMRCVDAGEGSSVRGRRLRKRRTHVTADAALRRVVICAPANALGQARNVRRTLRRGTPRWRRSVCA
jgi:hypothetical protein